MDIFDWILDDVVGDYFWCDCCCNYVYYEKTAMSYYDINGILIKMLCLECYEYVNQTRCFRCNVCYVAGKLSHENENDDNQNLFIE